MFFKMQVSLKSVVNSLRYAIYDARRLWNRKYKLIIYVHVSHKTSNMFVNKVYNTSKQKNGE